jgi:hypothetical protein
MDKVKDPKLLTNSTMHHGELLPKLGEKMND